MATGMEKLLNANRVSLSKRFPGSVLANGGPDDPDDLEKERRRKMGLSGDNPYTFNPVSSPLIEGLIDYVTAPSGGSVRRHPKSGAHVISRPSGRTNLPALPAPGPGIPYAAAVNPDPSLEFQIPRVDQGLFPVDLSGKESISSSVPEEVASPEEVNRVDTQVEDGLLATKPGSQLSREQRDAWKQQLLDPDYADLQTLPMTREAEEQPKLGLPSESITVAEAPRSFFDRIRGGISRIGDALSTEGVSEALGQFSQDIIATPDIGTALGPALSNAQAQLELGQERAALEEMGPMEIAMDALRRGDSQSAMQALNAYEILNPTPDMKIDLLSNDLVRHPVTGQTGYLAQQGGKHYFLPAESAEAANISEASVESGLARAAHYANRAMTLSNGDLDMAGVRYETDENGNPYQVEGEVAGVMSPEFFNAMLAEFTSKAKQGDEGFLGNITRRMTQALTREGMPFEGAESAINAYTEAYNFINPVVRFLSGAQMTDAEAKRYYTALMTVPGDSFEIAMNKRRKRDILDRAMNGDLDAQAEITGNSILFGPRGERGGIFSPTEDPNGTAAQRAILEGLDSYIVRNGGNAGGVYGDQSLRNNSEGEDDEWELK